MNNTTCPFCQIDIEQSRIIYQGAHCYVMFSHPRLLPCHILVIPKRHVLIPEELRSEERKELFDTLLNFQSKIISTVATGCDIRQNYRPFIKQSQLKVDHVHFHLLPRNLEDEIFHKIQIFERQLFMPLLEDELQHFSSLLTSGKAE